VRLLLDTHYVYMFAAAFRGAPASEKRFFERSKERFVVSAVAVWEMRLKWSVRYRSGARKGPQGPEDALAILRNLDLDFLPLTPDHSAATLETPLGHRDPFDDLLLVQAQVEGMKLVSRDALLEFHPLVHSL
jgi:PIN domain nuclease of toxin-antitoxin system